VEVPVVRNYSTSKVEPFNSYYARWPKRLANFPECVVNNWVYRHFHDFKFYTLRFDIAQFQFERTILTNSQVLEIGHVGDWMTTLDYWGDDLFQSKFRRDTWLAKFMLESGTTPAPIIVALNAAGIDHPTGGQMRTPMNLVEGHMRLAYLRGMIRHKHPALKSAHPVWMLRIPRTSFMANRHS
jgi:hypothetical protein